jgi:hypothetical protein
MCAFSELGAFGFQFVYGNGNRNGHPGQCRTLSRTQGYPVQASDYTGQFAVVDPKHGISTRSPPGCRKDRPQA